METRTEEQIDGTTRSLIARLGARVRELRQTKGLTQDELAGYCGCQRTAIVRLESVDNPPRGLALSTLVQIAAGLDVALEVRLG